MDDSSRRLQQRRNQPSFSSSSSTGPTRFRSQNFSTNPTKTTQSSNFVPRSNSTTATTPNNTRNPGHIRNRKSETYDGINQQQEEQEAREDVGSIIGTCPFMCPDGERAQRERLRDLAVFERLHGDPRKTSPSLAVKKVKFHVISHQRLRNCTSSSISSLQYLNMEQLTKALASLYVLYAANRNNNFVYKNEAQFRSFYVLLHLDSKNQQMEESLSYWFRNVPSPVMKSKEMHFARQVLRFYRMGNYKRFLCTVSSEASYLQYCIIEPNVNEVRALAISYINNCCYKLHPYPLEQLSKLLMMKELDVESLCHACGLKITSDDGENKSLPTKQTTFSIPKESLQSYELVGLQQ
ncbi:SAC3 family protein C isoform X2 [Gossypium raimondii]|uniref:SAC3 family protein C isoform X2 n=1 Tax=Gossypium raimondii TaxID=29730 RepID=UPI00227CF84E|nr:SAC3 family protein C isoform X2 [Gossypium raimondii]